MKVGDKVRTTYQHSETATIVKPRKREGVPGSGWHIIRQIGFDSRNIVISSANHEIVSVGLNGGKRGLS